MEAIKAKVFRHVSAIFCQLLRYMVEDCVHKEEVLPMWKDLIENIEATQYIISSILGVSEPSQKDKAQLAIAQQHLASMLKIKGSFKVAAAARDLAFKLAMSEIRTMDQKAILESIGQYPGSEYWLTSVSIVSAVLVAKAMAIDEEAFLVFGPGSFLYRASKAERAEMNKLVGERGEAKFLLAVERRFLQRHARFISGVVLGTSTDQ